MALKNLPEESIDRIDLKFGRLYRKGNYIFKQGEWGNKMFIMKEGRLKVIQELNGIEVDSFIVNQGEVIGELSIIDPKKRYASGIALEDSFVLSLSKEDFIEVISKNPTFSLIIMQTLAKIIRRADEELNILRSGNIDLIIINRIFEILLVRSRELKTEENLVFKTQNILNKVVSVTKTNMATVRNVLEKLNMKNILEWNEEEVKVKELERIKQYKEILKSKEGVI